MNEDLDFDLDDVEPWEDDAYEMDEPSDDRTGTLSRLWPRLDGEPTRITGPTGTTATGNRKTGRGLRAPLPFPKSRKWVHKVARI